MTSSTVLADSSWDRSHLASSAGRPDGAPCGVTRAAPRSTPRGSESQYYVEPKRIASLGYVDAHKKPGKTRERTVYTLTDKGLEALLEYARTPVQFTPLKSEPLLRLLIADLVGEAPTRQSLATLREDIADLSARLDEAEASAETLPHRRKYLLLVADFLRRLLALHLELVDEVERELAPSKRRKARQTR